MVPIFSLLGQGLKIVVHKKELTSILTYYSGKSFIMQFYMYSLIKKKKKLRPVIPKHISSFHSFGILIYLYFKVAIILFKNSL